MTDLAGLLACPRCDTALDHLTCKACRVEFPRHGALPWLFADPGAAVSDWRNRWHLTLEQLQRDLRQVEGALQRRPTGATRRRLEVLAQGYRAQRAHLTSILEPLELAPGASLETLLALRTRVPGGQDILGYQANVHRDWSWGAAECDVAVADVRDALGSHVPQRILVLGAGAGRLAYDLHQQTTASITVALDINPLLAYVGATVSGGASVPLVEFPLAPRTPQSAAVERRLQAPAPSRPGLQFLLGDALRPPFLPGCFDVVVTPWLLDVVGAPATDVLPRINTLLGMDGWWINQGAVAFDAPEPEQRLTLDELLELTEHTGFTGPTVNERSVAYMDCPDSRHARRELVVTMASRKRQPVPPKARHQSLPDWIAQGRTPIPALPAFQTQAMTTRMHAFLMTLIDGQRSLEDMAGVLEAQQLMSRADARVALRGFLIRLYEEARRLGRPDM